MTYLWVVFTVVAAAGQTARNAMQRELTASLGSVGATHVRFLFGFPFALLFLAAVTAWSGGGLPATNWQFWLSDVAGALAQIGGTALMLKTMTERSFVVTTAYLKTEPLFVAALGLVFLHDPLTLGMAIAIVVATSGVVLISLRGRVAESGGWHSALYGLSAGGLFAVSAIGYRGAILSLHLPGYVIGATFTLAVGLVIQAAVLSAYLAVTDMKVLRAIFRLWRPSLFAGFMGSAASEFWFLAFALASAASVRTLGLIDVLFAQMVSHILFKQKTTMREAAGIVLLVAGAILLVYSHR
ncbi:MAG: DMT family transporter [Alphaproteobacteria bacterium]|nr:DMT family transporter [Alphaproteobacteria bacterium]MBL7097989.1 DMT family transporter [Alphaproteobacteria bacterium]